ncbi:MAG: hypothetical protein KatS3mg124_0093 [Porticoccaceae bacterium]|nr:MAG: hypothetical protein KatS3mg124_0093 [Porticoccaceae bacterium]
MSALARLAILALALAAPLWAEEAPWYQVEVIAFLQPDLSGREGHPPAPRLDYPEPLRFVVPPPAAPGRDARLAALMVPAHLRDRDAAALPEPFSPLPGEAWQLRPAAARLARADGFRVLFHAAWVQPAAGKKSTPWVHVSGGSPLAEGVRELEGALRIWQGRFLHLEARLWRAEPPAPGEEGRVALPPPPRRPLSAELIQLGVEPPPTVATGPLAARVDLLAQSRTVSPGRLVYLDHPRLGVLALVTPLASEGDPQGETARQ